MKALSIHTLSTLKLSIWDFAKFLFPKSQGQSTQAEAKENTAKDLWSELNFFQDEGELENYLHSFRE